MNESKRERRLAIRGGPGKEIFEITPVILGGSANDPENKVLLNREEHVKAVVYWNRTIRELREKRAVPNNEWRVGPPFESKSGDHND